MRCKCHKHSPHTLRSLTLDVTLVRMRRLVVTRARANERVRACHPRRRHPAPLPAPPALLPMAQVPAPAPLAPAPARAEWLSENAIFLSQNLL